MLAQVKREPAQAIHPVRYDTNLAYFLEASWLVQKYWPPASGIAEASSDNDTAIAAHTTVTMMIP